MQLAEANSLLAVSAKLKAEEEANKVPVNHESRRTNAMFYGHGIVYLTIINKHELHVFV